MRHRSAGGENLYNADEEISYNEKTLAMFAYLLDFDPTDVDLMLIDDAIVALRRMWRYSSDLRGSAEPTYTNNAIPRFFSKNNALLTGRLRTARWNCTLAKAAKNGE
jgi:hypothetical protein